MAYLAGVTLNEKEMLQKLMLLFTINLINYTIYPPPKSAKIEKSENKN